MAARRSVAREVALPDQSSRLLAHQLVASGSTPSQQLARRELARQVRQALAQMNDLTATSCSCGISKAFLTRRQPPYSISTPPPPVSATVERCCGCTSSCRMTCGWSETYE